MNMFEYLHLVNEIADDYFDDGIYQPQFGELNAMRLWYNTTHEDKISEDGVDKMAEVIKDNEFIKDFYTTIAAPTYDFDFSKAYQVAMEIVDYKKTSFGNILDSLNYWLTRILHDLQDVLSEDTIEQIVSVAEGIKHGETTTEAIGDLVSGKLNVINIQQHKEK